MSIWRGFVLATAILLPSLAAQVEAGDCAPREGDQTVLAIPVRLQFSRPELRSGVVYNALHPRLARRDEEPLAASSSSISNGWLELQFCTPWNLTGGEEIELLWGPRRVSLIARTPRWIQRASGEIRLGEMAAIELRKLPGPEWTMLLSADWLETKTGEMYLDVALYNPTASNRVGSRLTLKLGDTPQEKRCMSPSDSEHFEVELSVSEEIELMSSDSELQQYLPEGHALVRREAKLTRGQCGELDLLLDLGEFGDVAPGSKKRLLYRFDRPAVPRALTSSSPRALVDGYDPSFFGGWLFGFVQISGEVFPKSIQILGDFEDRYGIGDFLATRQQGE